MTTTTTTMKTPRENHPASWRPVAYLTIQDSVARARIAGALERVGWTVIPQPTGFHLIQAIAGVIDGHQTWLRPGLIAIDANSRGCAGTTIAAGLRDLGITIPIVLIAAPGAPLPLSPDPMLRIVDTAGAEAAVTELARLQHPAALDRRQPAA